MNVPPDPSPGPQHPLAGVPEISPSSMLALKRHWIETAEQLLATSATPEGRAGLATLLQCDAAALDALLATLQKRVGPEEAHRLAQSAPGGACGAVFDDVQTSDRTAE